MDVLASLKILLSSIQTTYFNEDKLLGIRMMRACLLLLAIFPCVFAAVTALLFYVGWADWEHYFSPHFASRSWAILATLALMAALAALAVGLRSGFKDIGRVQLLFLVPSAIALLGLSLRLACIIWIGRGVVPFSDFAWAYETARGSTDYSYHYSLFPAWYFYAVCLGGFFDAVGGDYVAVQCMNALAQSFTVVALYYIALLSVGRRPAAVIAPLLYAVSPTNVFYCLLLSPETPAIALSAAAMLLLVNCMRASRFSVSLASAGSAGLLLGFAECLKPTSPIFLAAFALLLVLSAGRVLGRCMTPADNGVLVGGEEWARRALSALVVMALLVGCFCAVKAVGRHVVEDRLGEPVIESSMPSYLFIGLAHDGEGQIHLGEKNHWHLRAYEEHGYDFEAANEEILAAVAQDVGDHVGNLPMLFLQKSLWAWQSDVAVFKYAENAVGQSWQLGFSASLAQAYYLLVMALAAAGAVSAARAHRESAPQGKSPALLLAGAVVLGFALLLLISEAQSRYKILAMPYVTLFAALGADGAASAILSAVGQLRAARGLHSRGVGR